MRQIVSAACGLCGHAQVRRADQAAHITQALHHDRAFDSTLPQAQQADLRRVLASDGHQQEALLVALRTPTNSNDPIRIEVDARRADGSDFPAEVSIARSRPPPPKRQMMGR